MLQADFHLIGPRALGRAGAVGRRVAEQEWDLIELLAPEACRAATAAPLPRGAARTTPTRYGRPTARELLDAVREFLTDEVMTSDDRRLAYQARVAANVLAIVERELAQEPVDHEGDDWTTLALAVRDRLAVANPRHLARS